MRPTFLAIVCCAGLFAQNHSGTGPIRPGAPTFTNNGNILHPGIPGNVSIMPTTPSGGNHGHPGTGNRGGRANYPVYAGGVYGYGVSGFSTGGYTTVYNPPPGTYDPIFGVYSPEAGGYPYQPPAQTPVVVINQNFQPEVVRPQIIDYTNSILPPPGPQASQPNSANVSVEGDTPLILIAMKDHTIYPALAYWIQGDTVNYVMAGGAVNHVSLAQIDRELSAKLNAERRPDFKLP